MKKHWSTILLQFLMNNTSLTVSLFKVCRRSWRFLSFALGISNRVNLRKANALYISVLYTSHIFVILHCKTIIFIPWERASKFASLGIKKQFVVGKIVECWAVGNKKLQTFALWMMAVLKHKYPSMILYFSFFSAFLNIFFSLVNSD